MSMQVFVRGSDELFGVLNLDVPRTSRFYEIAKISDLSISPKDWVTTQDTRIETIRLEIKERNLQHRVAQVRDMVQETSKHEILRKNNIPEDATVEVSKDFNLLEVVYRFSWRAMICDPKDAEDVFELDYFEPC